MKIKFLFLFIVLVGLISAPNKIYARQNDPTAALKLYKEAEGLYNKKQYSQASDKLDLAVNAMGKSTQAMKDLRKKINTALSEERKKEADKIRQAEAKAATEQARREKAERMENYNDYLNLARSAINSQEYSNAYGYIDQALSYHDGSEAHQLRQSIRRLINRDEAANLIKEGESYENKQQFREAYSKYREAQSVDPQSISSSKVESLKRRIDNYDLLSNRASASYTRGDYAQAIDALDKAATYMALSGNDKDLLKRSNYALNKQKADNLFKNRDYSEAAKSYTRALEFAYNDQTTAAMKQRVAESNIEFNLSRATQEFNEKNWTTALSYVKKAEQMGPLAPAAKKLKSDILNNIEASDWSKATTLNSIESYKAYLEDHYGSTNAATAKSRISDLYERQGETQLKQHDYDGASSSFTNASDYDTSKKSSIDKKLKKVESWRDAASKELAFEVQLPIGFTKTDLTSRDFHIYRYNLRQGGQIMEQGIGHQTHSQNSFFTPLAASVSYNIPARIDNIRPINFFVKGFISSTSGDNFEDVAPEDYTVYTTRHEPTNMDIASVDTLYTMTNNAYSLNRMGVQIGIQPIPYLKAYIPIQQVKMKFQPGLSCLDCDEEQIETGKIGMGLGFEAILPIGARLVASAFWENWNPIFNTEASTNELFEANGTGGEGLFTPQPLSRLIGASLGYRTSYNTSLLVKYENPLIRGNFSSSENNPRAVRSFSQHIFNIGVKITIY